MSSADAFPVTGSVAPAFEPVREAFSANFEEHGEVGAAFCLYLGGRKVVDIWGGIADQATGRAWREDTLIPVFSVSKAATAVCALLLSQRDELDLDAPVAEYWPEFGAEGKEQVLVKWLLSHRAGLPCLDTRPSVESVLAWEPVVEALAVQRPLWEPGTAHGYHALTYGWLVGEVVRRISGRSLGSFFAEEVARPLGLDFWVGLPASLEARVGRLVVLRPPELTKNIDWSSVPEAVRRIVQAHRDPSSLTSRALNLTQQPLDDNSPEIHAAEIPAHNGIANARSLARMLAALIGEVDGKRLLSPETVKSATVTQSDGPDRVLLMPTRFGLGFMLSSSFSPFGSPSSFGHPGAGGSLAFADPDIGYAFGYTMNKMASGLAGDPRTIALIDAVRNCTQGACRSVTDQPEK